MARARRTSNPVTLFPFLAVLLCTIGALVLMLVVVSAGIRKDAVASAKAKQGSKADVVAALEPLVERVAEIIDEPAARHRPIEPLLAADPLPSPIEEAPPQMLADLDNLQRVAQQLQAEVAARSKRIENMSAKTQALQHQLKMVKGQQSELQRAIIRTASQRAELEKSTDELRVENQQVIEWLDDSRKLIGEHAKQLLSPVHSIVPYDGQTGTVRRPIIIECVGGVVRFEAEQVEISVDLLKKFSPEQNPLAAGVQALFGYWMAKDQQADPGRRPRKPYALILVRPSGAEAFSSAVFALDELIGDFGYELVETEFQYELPETTTDAIRECRAAVEAELRRGPVRSRRVLNPQGPVDISRVARGPAASRSFFSSDDFRNRRSGSSVAGDGIAAPPAGGQVVGGSPANRGTSRLKGDQQAASGLSESLLNGLVAQGNSLLQAGPPSSFDSARAAALADAAQLDADALKTGGSATGESQTGRVPDRNGVAERDRNSEKNGTGGGTQRDETTGSPRWLADTGGRPAVEDGEQSPGSVKAGSGAGAGKSDGGGAGDGRESAGGSHGEERGGSSASPGSSPSSGDGVEPQPGQNPSASGRNSPNGSQSSPSPSSTENASNGGSSSGSDGSPVSGNAPTMRPPSRSNQVRSLKTQRRWGLSHPGASLGLEKVVVITVEAGRVVIGNQYQVTRRPELSTAQVLNRTILALDQVAKTWGWPPPRFYWVPSVRLEFNENEQRLGMMLQKALKEAGAGLEK